MQDVLVALHIFILISLRNYTKLRVIQPQQCQVIVLVWQYIVKANPFYYQNLHNIEKSNSRTLSKTDTFKLSLPLNLGNQRLNVPSE